MLHNTYIVALVQNKSECVFLCVLFCTGIVKTNYNDTYNENGTHDKINLYIHLWFQFCHYQLTLKETVQQDLWPTVFSWLKYLDFCSDFAESFEF